MPVFQALLNRKIGLAAAAALLGGTVFVFWPEAGVAIDDACKPSGTIPLVRSLVQGERFWSRQIENIDSRLITMKRQAEIAAAANLKLEATLRRSEEMLSDLYAKNPARRPSPGTLAAEALREQASDIESAEMQEFMDKAIAKRGHVLRTCRNQIAAGVDQ
jgi:hypothetical protein